MLNLSRRFPRVHEAKIFHVNAVKIHAEVKETALGPGPCPASDSSQSCALYTPLGAARARARFHCDRKVKVVERDYFSNGKRNIIKYTRQGFANGDRSPLAVKFGIYSASFVCHRFCLLGDPFISSRAIIR